MRNRSSDRARRYLPKPFAFCKRSGDIAVGNRFTVRNLSEDGPHRLPKIASCRSEREFSRIRSFPRKISIEPTFYFDRCFIVVFRHRLRNRRAVIFLPFEPQSDERSILLRQEHIAERRRIKCRVYHNAPKLEKNTLYLCRPRYSCGRLSHIPRRGC